MPPTFVWYEISSITCPSISRIIIYSSSHYSPFLSLYIILYQETYSWSNIIQRQKHLHWEKKYWVSIIFITYIILDKLFITYVLHPGIKKIFSVTNRLLLVGIISIYIIFPLWSGKFFQNQPWIHTPNNIHNLVKSVQWRTLFFRQYNNLL